MDVLPQTEQLAAEICNAAWLVRHYRRPSQRRQRAEAIQKLGLAVRAAFNTSDDFEPLLIAVLEGLSPHDYQPPFQHRVADARQHDKSHVQCSASAAHARKGERRAVKITFARPRGDTRTFGPFRLLVFRDGEVRADLEPNSIAVHQNHSWIVGDEPYTRFEVDVPVFAEFSGSEAPHRTAGPITSFTCVDGVGYADGRVFAIQDGQTHDWYSIDASRHWPILSLRPSSG